MQSFTAYTSAIKYKNWTKYTDGCIYRSLDHLKENDSEGTNIRNMWKILSNNSNILHSLQNRNFSQMGIVKTISGRIDCCSVFSIAESKYRYEWTFIPHNRLKMNLTFLEVNLPPGFEFDANEYLVIKYSSSNNFLSFKYLNIYNGKMNKFTIFSLDSIMYIKLEVYPSLKMKIRLMISVFDNSTITDVTYTFRTENGMKYFLHAFLYHAVFYNEIHLRSYHVVLNKLLKIKLKFNLDYQTQAKIELHDGPDDQVKLIKQIRTQVILSSFQCYLNVYAENIYNTTSRIYILPVKQDVLLNITLDKPVTFNSNICGQKETQHCIIQFNTNDMYLNMSIINMTFDGPNAGHCAFGGLTYHGINVKVGSNKFLTSLCGSYTQTPKYNSFDKIPMNYVTTEFYLLLIIYGYHPYNKGMELNIDISFTPCKGIVWLTKRKCKYIKYLSMYYYYFF